MKANGPIRFVECFRFDVPVGIEISLKLHARTRPKQKQRQTELLPSLEEGVCSPKVQQDRYLKRTSNIREIGHMLKKDLRPILMGFCPDRVDLERKAPQLGLKLKSSIKRPQQTKKRKKAGGEPEKSSVTPFLWDKSYAIKTTRSIASELGTDGFMPTRAQFVRVPYTTNRCTI